MKIIKGNGNQQLLNKSDKIQTMIGPASAITIGKKSDGASTMVKIQKPETNMVKIVNSPQTTSTNFHKVNIPGKGMQVVRLLNSQAPGTSQQSSPARTVTRMVTPQSQQHQIQQRTSDGTIVVRSAQAAQRTSYPTSAKQTVSLESLISLYFYSMSF